MKNKLCSSQKTTFKKERRWDVCNECLYMVSYISLRKCQKFNLFLMKLYLIIKALDLDQANKEKVQAIIRSQGLFSKIV